MRPLALVAILASIAGAAPNPNNNGCRDHGAGLGCHKDPKDPAADPPGQGDSGDGNAGQAGSSPARDPKPYRWIGGHRTEGAWQGVSADRARDRSEKAAAKAKRDADGRERRAEEAAKRRDAAAKATQERLERDRKAANEAARRKAKAEQDRRDRDAAAAGRALR